MVCLILADGFEEVEALTPVDLLRRADVEIFTVALNGHSATGAHGIRVTADLSFEEMREEECELLILPGGKGYQLLDEDERVDALLAAMIRADKPVAAICAAPSILGKRGYLDGRNATCFPSVEDEMGEAILQRSPAVRDGNLITGRAAGAAVEFSLEILKLLCGETRAAAIAGEIYFGGC